jgi:hypothetical protein
MLALNTVIAANPIATALVAVVAITGAMYALSGALDEATINGEGLVETLERITQVHAEKIAAQADEATYLRERAAAEELLQIERERAAVNASRATAEQKAIKLQVLADRAAAIERRRDAAALGDEGVRAQQEAQDAALARGVVEKRLSDAYATAGQRYAAGLKLQGQALADASESGVQLSKDQTAAVKAREVLMEKLSEEDREVLTSLEKARDEYLKKEADALKKSEDALNKREIAAIAAEIEQTRETARQAELRTKAREAEDAKTQEAAAAKLAAQQAVNDAIAEIDQAAAAIGLSEVERRDAAVRASFDKQIEGARKAFAALTALATSDAERSKIATEQAAAVTKAEQAKAAELERLRQQDIAGAREFGRTKEQLQVDEINKRFDLQRTETQRVIESEEEKTAILLAIEKNRADALAEITIDAAQQARERQLQDAQALLDSSRNLGNSILAIDSSITSNRLGELDKRIEAQKRAGKDATALEREREREQKEAARRAFQINRAFTLAQIAVDTARAISALVAASAGNPANAVTVGAAGAAQFAAGLIQITANVAQAVALLAQAVPGFAHGGEVDASWGPKTRRSNGDNVVATLQDKEIVLSRASRARAERLFGKGIWGDLGVPGFGGSVDWTAALARAGAATAARNGGAALVQGRDDRRIIGALGTVGSLREQRRQTELLEKMAQTRGRNPRARWA